MTAYIGLELGGLQPGETVVDLRRRRRGRLDRRPDREGARRTRRRHRGRARRSVATSSRSSASTPASTARAADWREQIDAATPDGIDVDFENVGGPIMDHVFMRLNIERAHHPLRDDLPVRHRRSASWQGQVNVGQLLMQRATMRASSSSTTSTVRGRRDVPRRAARRGPPALRRDDRRGASSRHPTRSTSSSRARTWASCWCTWPIRAAAESAAGISGREASAAPVSAARRSATCSSSWRSATRWPSSSSARCTR